ncbi:hypothetical protein BGZ65_003742 [Modicella reniformis]|uniref:Uncharacterized protein n=1 Tax=Modicella reniformis TaxID=1440133 RepID=A0A9P6MHH6_9FUNG|nr:hypothetical protein BGZ65_003742 [Modicella reniformis]
MSESTTTAKELMEDASVNVHEKTRGAFEAVKQSGPVQSYVMPMVEWFRDKFNRSPMMVRVTLITFGILSAVPVGCFMGFMSVVTLGCLIVGAIAFTVVEGGFGMFGSAFLLPALGLVLLITGAMGLFGLVLYIGYRAVSYVIGAIWGPGQKQEVQRAVERGAEKAGQGAEDATRS